MKNKTKTSCWTVKALNRGFFKNICYLLLFVSVSLHLDAGTIITDSAGPYNVGQNIGFDSSCHDTGNFFKSVSWNFGDGTVVSLGNSDLNRGWQYHTYRNPGTYTVTYARSGPRVTPLCFPDTETKTITVNENRYILMEPAQAVVGRQILFTAVNFNTPGNIYWDMGDGTIMRRMRRVQGGSAVTHTFKSAGTYTVRAYDWNGSTRYTAVTLTVSVGRPSRSIVYLPLTPRVEQAVDFEARNFFTSTIRWDFGDGVIIPGGAATQTHFFGAEGTYTVSAADASPGSDLGPVSTTVTVLPDIRFISVSPTEVRANEQIVASANHFYSQYILWDFGDGTRRTAGQSLAHTYSRPGIYTIAAQDYSGWRKKTFTATVTVRGIDDRVAVRVAEISLDNGKQYKIVPRNSKNIGATLKMKMQGTGIVAGYWLVDGHTYEFFSRAARQGELKEIHTGKVPGLPTQEPGMHTVTLKLTRPADENVVFPVLKYFVLGHENNIELIDPPDGYVTKDKEIPTFSWKPVRGASRYQVAFSDYVYPLLDRSSALTWNDSGGKTTYAPPPELWNRIGRNRWTYWMVRALDGTGNVVAESTTREIKLVTATVDIAIQSVGDLDGKPLVRRNNVVYCRGDHVLVRGSLTYPAAAKYLVLRVYADDNLVDQLLFRQVEKGETRFFETSIPGKKKSTQVRFQVLNTSSPSRVIGLYLLEIKK